MVGREVRYTLALRSTGAYEDSPLTVKQKVPAGWRFVRSEPPATADGADVIWTLGGLAKDGQQTIQAVFVPSGTGTVTASAVVTTADGLSAESHTPPRRAPGQPKLANGGDVPLANTLVRLRLPPEVQFARASAEGRHQPADGTVVWYLGTLPPREGRTLQLTCVARVAAAKALTSATATAEGLA